MDKLNINKILNREATAQQFVQQLREFIAKRSNSIIKRGFYFYGAPGCGKTYFVTEVLKSAGFDVIRYDAGDIRNMSVITNITKHNIPDVNIVSIWGNNQKRIAIVMDEIDGMNSGDKGGINALIKLIRPKKTKKQKTEPVNYNPIICIGNYHMDKKIKDLMKVCHTYELKPPNETQMLSIIQLLLPSRSVDMYKRIGQHVQGDLRQLNIIVNSCAKGVDCSDSAFDNIFQKKSLNEDAKQIVKRLINESFDVSQHTTLMNDTDRTIVGLLWHENIIDVLQKQELKKALDFYESTLRDVCIADYVDRITFQKQIWQFNEMSSLIKTFKGARQYHQIFPKTMKYNPSEVRFTKVLTKYSTEFNNFTFIQTMCQKLGMDKKDFFIFFQDLRNQNIDENEIVNMLSNYDITKLEVDRAFRMLDRCANEQGEPST